MPRRKIGRDWDRSSVDWSAVKAQEPTPVERANKLLAGQPLTPGERSEVLGAILSVLGDLDRFRSEGTLTPFGERRIETLTNAYHKLNTEELTCLSHPPST